MNRTLLTTIIGLFAISYFNVRAANDTVAVAKDTEITRVLTTLGEDEQTRRDIALRLAPIKGSQALATYIRSTPTSLSPLATLSEGARARFIQGLSFNKNGLTSYNYADLKQELTASQIYRILSLFGVEHTTSLIHGIRLENDTDEAIMRLDDNAGIVRPMSDYNDYRCVTPATCGRATDYICIGGNCAKE